MNFIILLAALIPTATGNVWNYYALNVGAGTNVELNEAVSRDRQLFNARDFEGWSKILDKDVVIVFPGHPAAKGRKEALTLIKTIRRIGLDFVAYDHLADYLMGDYYLSIVSYVVVNDQTKDYNLSQVPFVRTNDKNEEIEDRGTLMELYQKKNDKLLKKALFVVSSLTPWPVKKP